MGPRRRRLAAELKPDFNFPAVASHPLLRTDASPPGALPLTALQPGQSGVIVAVASDTGIGRRLLDLGFVPGTEVRVLRRAPLGDPVIFALRGMQICLRRGEAARVTVQLRAEGAART
jgi:ferrous iron transport protein A